MPKEASMAIGLATPLPAMSGAEPCTGSYMALRFFVFASISPSEADGSMPSEPGSMAAMSDSMSPDKVSGTMTAERLCPPPRRTGPAHELHAAGVGDLMLELDVLELAGVQLLDHLVPQHARLHHVALLHRGDLVAPLARELEGNAGDALDLVGVVDLGVDRALLTV